VPIAKLSTRKSSGQTAIATTIRLRPDVKRKIAAFLKRRGGTFSGLVDVALREYAPLREFALRERAPRKK
jgi:hypothetical protein